MNKKDVSKVLAQGSAKQRVMILAEDIARNRYIFQQPELSDSKEPLLTKSEFRSLSDSFKTPSELALWNKWREYDEAIHTALTNLQSLALQVQITKSNLRGYILLWDAFQNTELLANVILHETKNPKERRRIAQAGAKAINLLFTEVSPDEEGYLEINVDFEANTYKDIKSKVIGLKEKPRKTKEYSLWFVMNNVKRETETAIIKFISWRQATLDYMEENNFNVKTYKDMIEALSTSVEAPIIGWDKYQSDTDSFTPGDPNSRRDKLKGKFAITPNLKELEVDTEIYNYFKKEFLRDE